MGAPEGPTSTLHNDGLPIISMDEHALLSGYKKKLTRPFDATLKALPIFKI
jgi:hypothetical protein